MHVKVSNDNMDKVFLMLIVLGSVYCRREEVLYDTTAKSKLGWDRFNGGAGSGWLEKDYKTGDRWTRVYRVCDTDQKNPENYVTSPLLDVQGLDAMWIKVAYTVSKCTNESGCRFDIKSFESDSAAGPPVYVPWDPVIAINTSKSQSDTSINTGEINMPVKIKTKGNKLSIGFEDHGSGCTTITSFKAYLLVCDAMTSTLVTFPQTSVLASDREVKGRCMENAKIKSEPLSVCNVNGEWKGTKGECECEDSFELKGRSCIAVSEASRIGKLPLFPLAAVILLLTKL